MKTVASLILAFAAAFAPAAFSQEPPERVGRLAYTQGDVAIYQDPEQGWEKAFVNTPLTTENSLWTDPDARAEMRVSGIALRLDETTQLDISNLDYDDLEAFVAQGSVAVRVRHFHADRRVDLGTPHAGVRLLAVGRYRVDVDPDRNQTVLTVFSGTAALRGPGGEVTLRAGEAARIRGDDLVRERARTTEFDRWTLARDDKWIERNSVRYVSTDMTGYEDLDAYGEWRQVEEYGYVWYPRNVSSDWAPYRHGHWAWVRPWGWTWVAEEPWGYAPYHYGRWIYLDNRWAWYPGPRNTRPVWAPALVAWVGGANFSVGISGGSAPALGWYPLAPWERYEPWYRVNPTYVNRINVVVRDRAPRRFQGRDRDEWRYWNRDRGATVVRRDQFLDRRPVRQAMLPVAPEMIRRAPVAQPTNVLPPAQEFRRPRRDSGSQVAEAPFRRPGERGGPNARPNFERRQQAPGARPSAPQVAQPSQPAQQAPGSPAMRQDARAQERAARDAQQAQQRAAREQERAGREQAQAQERAAREQQRGQAQQQQQAGQQQQAQERAAREQQRGQAQQQQAEQQQRQQQQAQERAAREQAQAQQRAAREQQQAQERAAREQQRAQSQQQQAQRQQQQQQQAQERATREQAQAQQRGQAQQQQAQQQAERAQQQAQERAAREQQRGEPRAERPERERGRDKDDENPGKGKGR